MTVKLNQAYKLIPTRLKRYNAHYQIPAADVLIVPTRLLGSECLCDVRWEDDNGELQHATNLMFVNENLVPLNPLIDTKRYELWSHYYQTQDIKNEQ
jgi:hypothetical protein